MSGGQERDERRAALRAAYHAARSSSDRRPEELRRVFESELARRGVTDVTPAQVDAAATALQSSPARVAVGLLTSSFRFMRMFAKLTRDGHIPRWAESPNDAGAYEFPDEWDSVFAPVTLAPKTEYLIERMLSDCPHVEHPSDADGETPARLLDLWFDEQELAGSRETIPVHLGRYLLGSINGEAVDIVRWMLTSVSNPRLSVEGYLAGVDAASARIDIELPARP